MSPGPSTTVATATGSCARIDGDHLGQLGERRRVDRLDEDVDDAAAGQPDGERVVVADAVALQHRLAAGQHLLRQLVDRALDAAAGDAADRLAVGRRPPSPRPAAAARCARCRRRWPARTAAPASYQPGDLVDHVMHGGLPGSATSSAASRSSAARLCPSTKSSTCGSAAASRPSSARSRAARGAG